MPTRGFEMGGRNDTSNSILVPVVCLALSFGFDYLVQVLVLVVAS